MHTRRRVPATVIGLSSSYCGQSLAVVAGAVHPHLHRLPLRLPNPDFSLSVSPSSISVAQGATSSAVAVSATAENGFVGSVAVTIDGLPSGLTASPSSFSFTPGTSQPVSVTFSASASATTGNTTITVSGSSGALTHTFPVTLTVTGQSAADFTISSDHASVSLGVGQSVTAEISVAATGTTSSQVSLTATASSGVTATFSPSSLSTGQSSVLTVSTSSSMIAPASASIVVTGTASGGGPVHSLTIPASITIGGGTLNIVPRTQGSLVVPASAVSYINSLVSNATGGGLLYNVCGSASGTRMTEVVYDTSSGFYFEPGLNGANPAIHIPTLPNPGANGIDQSFDHPFLHEMGNALRDDVLAAQLTAAFTTTQEMQTDTFSEDCADFTMANLAANGVRGELPNETLESTLLVDGLSRFDATTVAGIRTQPGYDEAFQEAGEAAYRLLIGPQGAASLAAYEDAYFGALNAQGSLFSETEYEAFFNTTAEIDGMPAGDWFAANVPLMLATPTPATGGKLIVLPLLTQLPNAVAVQAFTVGTDASGAPTYTPVTSGAVTINVLNASGAQALAPFTTDLADTSISAPFVMGLQNALSQGAYELSVSATVGGQQLTATFNVLVVPSGFTGPYSADQTGPSYIFAISVDGNGNPTNGSLSVTNGTVVNSGTGFAVITAGSSGEVTVNGRTFTLPTTGSRVVSVPAH